MFDCPVFCRIHPLLLCRRERTPSNECSWYDTKQSDGEASVVLELWGMQSTSSLPSLTGQLWLAMVAPDRVLSRGQIELNCVLMLNWIAWNRTDLTLKLYLCITELFETELFRTLKVYLCYTDLFEIELFICIKMDLALITYNGWYAIKPNQTKSIVWYISVIYQQILDYFMPRR